MKLQLPEKTLKLLHKLTTEKKKEKPNLDSNHYCIHTRRNDFFSHDRGETMLSITPRNLDEYMDK